jgi:hypothetical protein
MGTRGMVYVVRARRSDDAWITYRTCDRHEAERIARHLGTGVAVA